MDSAARCPEAVEGEEEDEEQDEEDVLRLKQQEPLLAKDPSQKRPVETC